MIVSECSVIDFDPEHLIGFDDMEEKYTKRVDVVKIGEFHKKQGPSYSYEVNGIIVMCGGIHRYWEGMGEAWMCIRNNYAGPSVLKVARDHLTFMINKNNFNRVQAITIPGGKWARTMKFLGFNLETYMRKFGPEGIDKALWSRIK